jgi:hypothetical protein
LQGTASQIFQQWQQGQVPLDAQQQAQLQAQLGSMGVGGNSSVQAIAASNLAAQQNATAANVNAQLMQQNQVTQTSLLQGMQSAAEQEVASSGWDVFGQVMSGLGSLAGQVIGAGGAAGGLGNLFGMGSGAASDLAASVPSSAALTTAGAQLGNLGPELGQAPQGFSSILPGL